MTRLVLAGTPAFAATAAAAIARCGHDVVAVLTQPDRPAGRGMTLQASELKRWALAHGVPILQPAGLRLDGRHAAQAAATQAALQALQPELMVVAAYGLMLPQWALDLPRWGCLNIHASLLPRWRGAAPIQRAIAAGDAQTGVSIMQMDAGLDTGAVLLAQALPIDPFDTAASLHDKLAALGGELMVQALSALGQLKPQPQSPHGICYAAKIDKREAWLDWSRDATALACQVRALYPTPGAALRLGDKGELVKIWAASAHESTSARTLPPGSVVAAGADGLDIACASGVLRCTQLQRAGGKRLGSADFVRGLARLPAAVWSLARILETAP